MSPLTTGLLAPLKIHMRRPTGAARRALPCIVLLAIAGCGEGSATDPARPGIRVVSLGASADTVLALPAGPLVVEVRTALGAPLRGAVVKFQSRSGIDPRGQRGIGMLLCPPDLPECRDPAGPGAFGFAGTAYDTTDADGRAEMALRFGPVAGTAIVDVLVEARGMRDSVGYEVRPGNATGIVFGTPDTAVYAGASYDVSGTVVDRFRNPRPDVIAYSPANTAASVDAAGRVTAQAIGRGVIVAQSGLVTDTAWVSVVPEGTIAAVVRNGGGWGHDELQVVNLDASGRRRLAEISGPHPAVPAWSPGRAEVVFADYAVLDAIRYLAAVGTDGGVRKYLERSPSVLESGPVQFSADGSVAFFVGSDTMWNVGIWRAAADGSGAEMVVHRTSLSIFGVMDPAPSADGSRVVVERDGWLTVLTLATGESQRLGQGFSARWSPAGDLIAYVASEAGPHDDGPLMVVRPDGSGARQVTPPGARYSPWFDWSPDGEWIIVGAPDSRRMAALQLVRVADGEILPLRFPVELDQPSWKR